MSFLAVSMCPDVSCLHDRQRASQSFHHYLSATRRKENKMLYWCDDTQQLIVQGIVAEEELDSASVQKDKAPLICSICGKQFVQACRLESHIEAHRKGLIETKCAQCGKSFASPSRLKAHKRKVHERVNNSMPKKHSPMINTSTRCADCKRSFQSSSHLCRHLEGVHNNGVPGAYPCEECTAVLKSTGGRTMHMRRVHGEDIKVKLEN